MKFWPALDINSPWELGVGRWELIAAALTDFDVAAIDDNAPGTWRVFFHTADAREHAAAALRRQFHDLAVTAVDVPDEDWAARSQADLKAVRVGNIVVAPPWDVGAAGGGISRPDTITIVIQPSMGFGTAHHATTRLCLLHLQELELRNRTALDVGTGSGVLAIAASRLGATHVLAIDNDPDAIQSARENMELNPGAEVTLGVVDLRRARLRPFDVVLANLTGAMLTSSADAIQALAAPGGRLVLSGFLDDEAAEVGAAFSPFTTERHSRDDEWNCITLRRIF